MAGDVLGYIASTLVLATFSMRSMVPLRWTAIASNAAFIAYGAYGHLLPILLLHSILLPLNLIRLRELGYRWVWPLTLPRQPWSHPTGQG
jgi:hypothetical protein